MSMFSKIKLEACQQTNVHAIHAEVHRQSEFHLKFFPCQYLLYKHFNLVNFEISNTDTVIGLSTDFIYVFVCVFMC